MNKSLQIILFNFVYAGFLVGFLSVVYLLNIIVFVRIITFFQNVYLIYFLCILSFILLTIIFTLKIYLFFLLKRKTYFKNLLESFDNNKNVRISGIISAILFDLMWIYILMYDLDKIMTASCLFYLLLSFGGVIFSYITYLFISKKSNTK